MPADRATPRRGIATTLSHLFSQKRAQASAQGAGAGGDRKQATIPTRDAKTTSAVPDERAALIRNAAAAGHGDAVQAATNRERRRCAAIFASPDAAGRVPLACELAFGTDLPVDKATQLLAKTPAEVQRDPFASAMDTAPRHHVEANLDSSLLEHVRATVAAGTEQRARRAAEARGEKYHPPMDDGRNKAMGILADALRSRGHQM